MAEKIEKVAKAEKAMAQDVQNLSEDELDDVSGGRLFGACRERNQARKIWGTLTGKNKKTFRRKTWWF